MLNLLPSRVRIAVVAVAATTTILLLPARSQATTLTFDCITGGAGCDTGESQLSVEMWFGDYTVSFMFLNDVGLQSSITGIFFDQPDPHLMYLPVISESSGVNFDYELNWVDGWPNDLPGGDAVGFEASWGLSSFSSSSSWPGVIAQGINQSSEYLILTFLLGASSAEVLEALASGALRVGLYVQGFSTGGGGESFVNSALTSAAEPATLLLLGTGLAGIAGWARRRRRSVSG